MESTVDKRKRFPISLPAWHEKRLIWWAYLKEESKTGLAQNILQARMEANDEIVHSGLRELAIDLGVTVDDLKASILKGTSQDLSKREQS